MCLPSMGDKRRRVGAYSTAAGLAVNKSSDQRYPHVERDEEQILDKRRALFDALLDSIRFGSLRYDDSRDVFQEVDAAFVACATMSLFMTTGRTLVTQSGVTPLAKSSDVADLRVAFGALHVTILQNRDTRFPQQGDDAPVS